MIPMKNYAMLRHYTRLRMDWVGMICGGRGVRVVQITARVPMNDGAGTRAVLTPPLLMQAVFTVRAIYFSIFSYNWNTHLIIVAAYPLSLFQQELVFSSHHIVRLIAPLEPG